MMEKIESSDEATAELNETFHLSVNKNIRNIARMKTSFCFIYYRIDYCLVKQPKE